MNQQALERVAKRHQQPFSQEHIEVLNSTKSQLPLGIYFG
jgi:hypothetical protein